MMKNKKSYYEMGAGYYDEIHKARAVKNLEKFARRLGFDISPKQTIAPCSVSTC
jgi:hypothetical protein